ncbi:MAG: hypothetical protein JWO89_1538 [Verrucomicrobiaceae bacterium]|nr:hypothetical protein [Verrucomicrobiaceae bacterium]MDB6119684.1 hypothetical protein [Verrucomicrobiaceae bacterium]
MTLLHLAQLGVREACVAAGARNTPLITALLASTGIKLWNFFDERSAGFFALGRMMADRRPVAVLTTSGTAVAELLPAVVEAYYQALPLVLVTADRPSRFRGSGAPQAIEQAGIFGTYAEKTIDLEDGGPEVNWPKVLGRKPLHINVCLDEPLTGESTGIDFAVWDELAPHHRPEHAHDEAMLDLLCDFVEKRDDLLVLASGLHPLEALMVAPALRHLGAPIVAEATSNLHEHPALAPLCLVGGEKALRALGARRVLRLGSVPSWRWWRDLEDAKGAHLLHLSRASFPGLSRWGGVAVQPLSLLSQAAAKIAPTASEALPLATTLKEELDAALSACPESEIAWMRHLSLAIPEGARVFLGNSLPIREWNLAAAPAPQGTTFYANRGANGIDGLVSTFLGLSATIDEAWMIVGDLSALYDLSAPWLLSQLEKGNRRIVIINNGGGKIFSRVESLRKLDEPARSMIENRHDIDFEPWAQLWKLPYRRVAAVADLASLPDGAVIVEVRPDAGQTDAFWNRWQG